MANFSANVDGMTEVLLISCLIEMPSERVYQIMSNPEMLPYLLDHVESVHALNLERTHYLEVHRSIIGIKGKVELTIDRFPPFHIVARTNHWAFRHIMDIAVYPVNEKHCHLRWKVLIPIIPPKLVRKTLKLFFEKWYSPKLRKACERLPKISPDVKIE